MTDKQSTISTNEETLAAFECGKKEHENKDDDLELNGGRNTDKTFEKNIEKYTEAIRLDPNDAIAYFNRGGIYYFEDQYDKAIDDYTEAIRLDPDFARAYYVRGIAYQDKRQFNRSINDLTEAIRLGLNLYNNIESTQQDDLAEVTWLVSKAYTFRGYAYKMIDQHDKAINDFTEVIRLSRDSFFAYVDRGVAYKELGQMDKAIRDLEKALSLSPDSESIKELLQELHDDETSSSN